MSVTLSNGHLFIESISGGGIGSNAVANLRAHGISATGAAAPYAVAYNVTLPSGLLKQQFAIGKPTILGTVLHKITSLDISYGVNFTKPNDADTIWPSEIDPADFDLAVTIVARSPELFGVGMPTTATYTGGDTTLRFIQRLTDNSAASNGGFMDFTGSNHISGAVTGLVHVDQHYDASGKATGQARIVIACHSAGGVAPIVWTPSTTYSLA